MVRIMDRLLVGDDDKISFKCLQRRWSCRAQAQQPWATKCNGGGGGYIILLECRPAPAIPPLAPYK